MSDEHFPEAPELEPDEEGGETAAVAQWFVCIDGEVNGPLSMEQVSGMVRRRELLSVDLVWREGLADWTELREVLELQTLVDRAMPPLATSFASAPGSLEAESPTLQTPSTLSPSASEDGLEGPTTAREAPIGFDPATLDETGSMAESEPRVPNDEVVERSTAAVESEERSERNASATESDESAKPLPEPVASSAPQPEAELAAELNAVSYRLPEPSPETLRAAEPYSLANLVGAAASGTVSEVTAATGSEGGYAQGDGSGLIDLKMLAVGPSASASGEEEEVLAAQIPASGLADTASRFDSLAPQELATAAQQNRPVVMAAMGGAGIIAAAAVAFALIIGQDPPVESLPVAAVAPAEVAPVPALPEQQPSEQEVIEAREPAASVAAEEAVAAVEEVEEAIDEAPAAAVKPAVKKRARRAVAGKRARRAAAKRKARAAVASAPVSRPTEKSRAPQKSKASIDDLLNSAVGGGKQPAAAKNLPMQPSRDQVLAALRKVSSRVRACARGSSGKAVAAISVAGSTGKVTSANVKGVNPEVGRCMSRAIKGARFPRFTKSSFGINYPFRL